MLTLPNHQRVLQTKMKQNKVNLPQETKTRFHEPKEGKTKNIILKN